LIFGEALPFLQNLNHSPQKMGRPPQLPRCNNFMFPMIRPMIKIKSPTCLSFKPPSALRQRTHIPICFRWRALMVT
jgi:hypothetical protein